MYKVKMKNKKNYSPLISTVRNHSLYNSEKTCLPEGRSALFAGNEC